MQQINYIIELTPLQESHLTNIIVADRPAEWKKDNPMMRAIRQSITTQLDNFQNQKCCYCGLELWGTSRGEIEHIAPKASRKKAYPEFTFEKKNLALSCEYCNGSSKKGEINVVFKPHAIYSNCEFKLVHPYFDNPDDHYEWVNGRTQIQIRHKTWKGKYSIILFKLHTQAQANARGREWISKRKKNRLILNALYEKFIKIIAYRA
jgi:uncharacterized protein (TIGR02646 family)